MYDAVVEIQFLSDSFRDDFIKNMKSPSTAVLLILIINYEDSYFKYHTNKLPFLHQVNFKVVFPVTSIFNPEYITHN